MHQLSQCAHSLCGVVGAHKQGASLDREKSEEKKDTSFDRDSVPEGKAQQQHGAGQEAQQKTGKIGA